MKRYTIVLAAVILSAAAAYAEPPMKVLYSGTSSTKFSWQWPYHTTRTRTLYQTRENVPSRPLIYSTGDDPAQYRHYFRQFTYRNEWGYFFPKGTKLSPSYRPAAY